MVPPERTALVDDTRSKPIHRLYGFRLMDEVDMYQRGFYNIKKFLQASLNFLVTMHERHAKASVENWLIELHSQPSNALTEITVFAHF